MAMIEGLQQDLSASNCLLRLNWLAPNVVRVRRISSGAHDFPPDPAWLQDVFLPDPELPGGAPELRPLLEQDCLRLLDHHGAELFKELHPPVQGQQRVRLLIDFDIPKVQARAGIQRVQDGVKLSIGMAPEEAFYGWGEWFDAFQRKAGRLQLKIRDAIAMLQKRHTYSAIPIFLSTRGYAFFLLNSYPSRWRIDARAQSLQVEADGPGSDYLLIYGPSFKRILQTYTALTGRPPLLPRWAFGLWVTSYPQGAQERVLAHAQEHRRRKIPLDAVILDYHWEQRFHDFQWRRSLIPNPDVLIGTLKSLGIHLGLIQTPFVTRQTRPFQKWFLRTLAHNVPPGLEKEDERALSEYDEAYQKGYLAHGNALWWFGAGGMIDFTNPQAASWWNRLMRPLYEQGVAFFKNDDGEYLPEDGRALIGMDGREYHNVYGFYYGKALFEGMADFQRRSLIYARSVWAGSQRYPALFLGDQKPTFSGIQSTLRAGLNLSLLGFSYWSADVFGLDGKTTPETHMRYAQWALLNPVARYFWRPPDLDDSRFPWSHGPAEEANFIKYVQLRYRLLPYFCWLAYQAWKTGLPIIRPLVMEFQDDTRLAEIDDQVFLGESLMLCPVVQAGVRSRKIRLPQGAWHDFWSSQSWQGPGEIDYPAPLDCLPLLVRGGTILPLGPELQFIPFEHRFDLLELHIWPPYPAEGWTFEEDGQTLAYQSGHASLTHFTASESQDRLVITIQAAQGAFPEQPEARQVTLVLHGRGVPQQVCLDGKPLQSWTFESQSRRLYLSFVCPVQRQTQIEIF